MKNANTAEATQSVFEFTSLEDIVQDVAEATLGEFKFETVEMGFVVMHPCD